MERQLVQILLCLVLFGSFTNTVWGDLAITMEPPGPVKPGTDVSIICNISRLYQDSPVTWLRRTASVEFEIAKLQNLETTLYKSKRYMLDPRGTLTGTSHYLEIKSVKFEDIGEYGCTLEQSTNNPPKYTPLIVCSNPDSDWCNCIKKKNWADPTCAQEASNAAAANKRLKEGLGVCLGIAIIYGMIMTILAGIDCSARLHRKRLQAQKKAAAQAARRRNPYGDSEELTLDPEQAMNVSQEARMMSGTVSEPMKYPELTTQENGRARAPVQADIHDGGNYGREERDDRFAPPNYPGESYPRDQQYQDAVNALSNNYSDYRNTPNDQYNQYDHYDHGVNHMEPLNTVSQGYDRGQLPRSNDYNTPGKLSQHSADPQFNHINDADRFNFPNNRGAYSEQKPRQYGHQGHPNNVEPRRLDFAHTKAAEARQNSAPSAAYMSPDTSI